MASRSSTPPPDDIVENIVDIGVAQEIQEAFLEYSYSVIYARALPDARDGLKPVQRRILFGMNELGLRPDRPHVKSSRIVGEVMGKYHPHGDSAIYDTLVRLAQPFTMRLPLVDGHGNFGSLDDGPAASRYTEARMAPAAMLMVAGLDEDTVDFVPNYDDTHQQPGVLPAAFPNLLVNGASGIAVGMATNMAPHNLVEVVAAARHLLEHPDCSLEDLMGFVPGPDLPGGGRIIGLDGIREAYLTGRGSFRTRATARVESITPRRKGIVVTELPYLVGPEKVIERIKDLVQAKKLAGISDVKDLTDRRHGLQLVIEVRSGFVPEAVLEELYRLAPLEESFGINNVALVDGQPRTMGLKELLEVFVGFRTDVVRRRTAYRLARRQERLHLVEGLLIAIVDIDEVIQLIRSSDDAATAKARLMGVFDLTDVQATYILDLQLRRLTKFSRIELEKEQEELRRHITELSAILGDERLLRRTVSDELTEVAKAHGTPRRTVLLESAGAGPALAARQRTPRRLARGGRRPVLGAAVLDRPARADQHRRPAAQRGLPGPARRHRRGGPHHGSRGGRPGHLPRPDDPPERTRPADPADHQRRPVALRRCPPGRVRRPPARRGTAHPRLGRVGRTRPGPRHRLRRRQAGAARAGRQALVGPHHAQGRRQRRRRGRRGRRRSRPGPHHERRPAAALPRRLGPPPRARSRRHGRHPDRPR